MKRVVSAAIAGLFLGLFVNAAASAADTPAPQGYYRFPAIHGDTIAFVAEGDVWTVGVNGGVARRLTSHPGEETQSADLARRKAHRLCRDLRRADRGLHHAARGRFSDASHLCG